MSENQVDAEETVPVNVSDNEGRLSAVASLGGGAMRATRFWGDTILGCKIIRSNFSPNFRLKTPLIWGEDLFWSPSFGHNFHLSWSWLRKCHMIKGDSTKSCSGCHQDIPPRVSPQNSALGATICSNATSHQ